MTANGKLLLMVTVVLGVISLCAATFGGSETFTQIWMAIVSVSTAIAAGVCCAMCLIDTLLENEE
jgi:hypothetical protein